MSSTVGRKPGAIRRPRFAKPKKARSKGVWTIGDRIGLGIFLGERIFSDAVVFEELLQLHGCSSES